MRIFLLFFIASCYHTQPESKAFFSPDNFMYQNPAVPFNGHRLILIHGALYPGANHDNAMMNVPAYKGLVDSLANRGWQVVEFDLPSQPIQNQWADSGKAYRNAFLSKVRQAETWASETYGKADYSVGGISYGGLHALIAAEYLPEFTHYFAVLPVMKIGVLSEFTGREAPEFDATLRYLNLAEKRGYLAWNTSDERVGYQHTKNLYLGLRKLGAAVKDSTYKSGGHSIVGNLDYLLPFLTN